VRCRAVLAAAVMLAGCHTRPSNSVAAPEVAGSHYLLVWAGDADKRDSDFLAVVDVDRQSPTYAQVVTTLPVGAVGTVPHHTEYEMPPGGVLWANGFAAGRTFRLDLRDPTRPRLAGSFGDAGPFSHPHSFARLPNGNVLATFQHRTEGERTGTGGLVELDTAGRAVRYAPAAAPGIDSTIRPYSLVVVPALDRVVSTATDMHLEVRSRAVQVWRLSDLKLLHTLLLPPGPRGDENWLTAEPRVSGAEHSVVTLDVSNPGAPREVARLTLRPDEVPHWIALEPSGGRLVITGYRELAPWVLLADLDRATGALELDTTFRAPGAAQPGVYFGREQWPHGPTGPALPHGAVFARP
jgi:hypothetical protein